MKIVYIGSSDALSETITERLGQEGHEVFLLSDEDVPRRNKLISLHHFPLTHKGSSFEDILRSFSPDCIVFAGRHYLGGNYGDESDADVALLTQSLRVAADYPGMKFILLSSTEVYGSTSTPASEEAATAPVSERGMRYVHEEALLDVYRENNTLETAVLRTPQLYSEHQWEGKRTFLSHAYADALHPKKRYANHVYQPLHVSDLAEAIVKVLNSKSGQLYNVCGSKEVSAERLYHLLCDNEKIQEASIQWEKPGIDTLASDDKIRKELGWDNNHTLEGDIKDGKVDFKRAKKEQKEKKPVFPTPVRKVLEVIVLFLVFFGITFLCTSNAVLATVDWLLIYVILVALFYTVAESMLAAIFATVGYLFFQNQGVFTGAVGSTSYADIVLVIMEFFFLGFMVSYTTNILRERVSTANEEKKQSEDDYEELKFINEENVLIKNEYEERLLASKTGFPKLYKTLRRLSSLDPNRILAETVPVIHELVHTDTVAVYRETANPSLFELVSSLNDHSAMGGKEWNLSATPQILDSVKDGIIYQGALGTDEPSVVMPITCNDHVEAVVLIKRLPYESETLYHVNLLKTVSLILEDALTNALRYEAAAGEGSELASAPTAAPVASPTTSAAPTETATLTPSATAEANEA